jgi:hypothetical protein
MQADFGWNDESPRFALNTLWFLLGVMVFAFTVLVMAAIVSPGRDGGAYLNVAPQQQEQSLKPAASTNTQPARNTGTAARTAR